VSARRHKVFTRLAKSNILWLNAAFSMAAQTPSVLIVDDSFAVRLALRAFIERTMGMRVCATANSGVDAIQKAEQSKPDIVLLDLSMPGMNGLDAAAAIRRVAPQARVVVFTLFSDTLGELLAKMSGVDLVLSKTDGTAGLLHALGPLLQNSPQSAKSPAGASTLRVG